MSMHKVSYTIFDPNNNPRRSSCKMSSIEKIKETLTKKDSIYDIRYNGEGQRLEYTLLLDDGFYMKVYVDMPFYKVPEPIMRHPKFKVGCINYFDQGNDDYNDSFEWVLISTIRDYFYKGFYESEHGRLDFCLTRPWGRLGYKFNNVSAFGVDKLLDGIEVEER